MLRYGQPLTRAYLALAALAFLISAQVVSDPVLDCSGNRGISMLLQHRIFGEWLLVSAALLLLAFAFKVTEMFSRRVILTWFAVTPFVVVAAQPGSVATPRSRRLRGKIQQSHIIIGANEVGCAAGAAAAARIRISARSRASSTIAHSERLPGLPQEQLLGGMTDIVNYVRLNSVSSIYICLPMRPDERVTTSAGRAEGHDGVGLLRARHVSCSTLMQAQVCEIDGIPLLAVCETPFAA